MTSESLHAAQKAARDFLDAVKRLQHLHPGLPYTAWGTKASGEVRRKSMDLTRALATMRRPQ